MHDHDDPVDELEAARRERQDRADRALEQAGGTMFDNVRPIDVDELERSRAAAGPIRSTPDRLVELDYVEPAMRALERDHGLTPPRIVLAGNVVEELERQHRRAYRRRQEARARAARRRQAIRYGRDLLTMALIAGAGAVALLALFVELNGAQH